MAASDLINLSGLMDDAKCFALVRQHRWPEGVCCPVCGSSAVIRDGCDDKRTVTQARRQRSGRDSSASGRSLQQRRSAISGGAAPSTAGHRPRRC